MCIVLYTLGYIIKYINVKVMAYFHQKNTIITGSSKIYSTVYIKVYIKMCRWLYSKVYITVNTRVYGKFGSIF